jgi:hypothetical protein
MKSFSLEEFKELCELLTQRKVTWSRDAETFALAMTDIRQSAAEIYNEFLPKLMEQLRTDTSDVDDTISDIREACRHIDYHLKDAKLPPGS